jgi:hypothetical protein
MYGASSGEVRPCVHPAPYPPPQRQHQRGQPSRKRLIDPLPHELEIIADARGVPASPRLLDLVGAAFDDPIK